MHKHNKLPSFI